MLIKIEMIMSTLKKGSKGAEVKALQKRLNVMADGIFGPLTEEAVKEFQKANGLIVDGIVGNNTWRALGVVPAASRYVDEIIVHCTATPDGEDFTVDQIRKMHLARGFSDVGYHYIIYRDGSIHVGRSEAVAGAHTTGHNTRSIAVCYVGGCPDRSDKAWMNKGKDTRTPAQKAALLKILKELKVKYPNARIYGHRNFAAKACPSFDAKSEYAKL